jgi:hypothetical protein
MITLALFLKALTIVNPALSIIETWLIKEPKDKYFARKIVFGSDLVIVAAWLFFMIVLSTYNWWLYPIIWTIFAFVDYHFLKKLKSEI